MSKSANRSELLPGNPLTVWKRMGFKENQAGFVDRLATFAWGPSETAGPSPTLPRISRPAQWRWPTSCGFLRKPHTSPWVVLRSRKSESASVGMTKLRAVAHLGMSGSGWTESKKTNWDKSD
jgi:hypothetical protein